MARNALGKGLGALIRDVEVAPQVTPASATTASAAAVAPALAAAGGPLQLDIDLLDPSPYQPRTRFSESALEELAQSIRSSGIIQPLVVRKIGARYQLIAGERRWRAAQRIPWHSSQTAKFGGGAATSTASSARRVLLTSRSLCECRA